VLRGRRRGGRTGGWARATVAVTKIRASCHRRGATAVRRRELGRPVQPEVMYLGDGTGRVRDVAGTAVPPFCIPASGGIIGTKRVGKGGGGNRVRGEVTSLGGRLFDPIRVLNAFL